MNGLRFFVSSCLILAALLAVESFHPEQNYKDFGAESNHPGETAAGGLSGPSADSTLTNGGKVLSD